MKHYRIITVIALCLAFLLSSCSSDDDGGSNLPASISQAIQAEWYSPDAERYMNFEFMYVAGVVYQNMSTFPETAETFSGQWGYSRGGVLSMDITYDISLVGVTESYYVLQCDDITLKMRHTSLGMTLDYYKIVESYKGRIGDHFDIEYAQKHPDFASATYTTSNADIADVDSNGRLTIKGGGLAFITVTSSAGKVVIKVDGGQRIDSYTAEIAETIDQVLARHGEPDTIVTNKSGTLAVIYKTPQTVIDSAIELIAYAYDADTREVTLEEIHYRSVANQWFQNDEDYLIRDFYLYLNTEGLYAPSPTLLENHYFISVIKNDTANGLLIYNRDYLSIHNHY